MFFVWKRNDGYINASKGAYPSDYTTGGEYRSNEGAGIAVTFERLGQFENWEDAKQCIIENCNKCNCRACEAFRTYYNAY